MKDLREALQAEIKLQGNRLAQLRAAEQVELEALALNVKL